MDSESTSKEYLLPYADRSSSEKSAYDDVDVDIPVRQRPSFWRRALPWILHLGLIAAYTTFFFMSMDYVKNFNSVFGLLDSPAKTAGKETHLEIFDIQGPPHGIYTGEPRPELDKAWRDLLQYNNIRVSEDWVKRYEREHEAVKLPDGGYLGMLSVFHEVHCIKRLYQTMFPDYYFPNASQKVLDTNREHNMHCLEVLRMGAMCRGDVSIITHMWTEIDAQPIVNQTAPHQCIDFSKVMDYSRENMVDVYQDNYIIHPKFGASFPHGHSIKPFEEEHPHE